MNETGKPFRTVKVGQKEMPNVVLELHTWFKFSLM